MSYNAQDSPTTRLTSRAEGSPAQADGNALEIICYYGS